MGEMILEEDLDESEDVELHEDVSSFMSSLKAEYGEEQMDEVVDEIMDYDSSFTPSEDFYKEKEKQKDAVNKNIIDKQKEHIKKQKAAKELEGELDKLGKEIFPPKSVYRSILLEYFTPEVCIELEKIRRAFNINNNSKMVEIRKVLNNHKIPYESLGGGTNRYGIMIDGYAVKIAYDEDGMIDNKREFIYSLPLQPYVVKTYECSPTGLISVCEYVLTLSINDFNDYDTQEKMRKILKEISSQFMIGDVGIDDKNYANWGIRKGTGELVILDFAYIYSVSFRQLECTCNAGGILYYDKDFINCICPDCGKKFTFSDLRKTISKQDQDEEIGDISEKAYIITKPEEKLEFNHRWVYGATDKLESIYNKRKKKEERRKVIQDRNDIQSWD